jgi:hypothetical protein
MNSAKTGGAIYFESSSDDARGTFSVTANSSFIGNEAVENGGAICYYF